MGNDIILLGICVVILILIIFFYIKDRGADKKFERFDLIITENMQEIFLLKKEIAELKKNIGNKDEISKQIIDEIENKIAPVLMSLKSVDSLMKKNLALNAEEIISAYKSGKSIEEISKTYDLDTSRVEFILKFSKIL